MANYIIDLKTKQIIPQENEPVVLVMGEHLSQSITFECDRHFNGKDLKEDTNIAIHYINADGTTDIDSSEDAASNRHKGGQVSVDSAEDDEDKIIITWTVGQIFTNAAGIGRIAIQFYSYADEKSKEFAYCLRTEEADIEIKDSFLAKSNLIFDNYKYEQFLSDRNIPYEYNKVFIIDNKDIKPFTRENYDTSVVGDNGVTKLYFIMNNNIDGVLLSDLDAVTFMIYYKTPMREVGFDANVIATIDKDWGYCLLTWEIPGKICLNEGDVYYSVGFSFTDNEVNKRWFTKVATIHVFESSVLVTGEDIGVEDSFLQDLLTRLAIVENKTSDVNMGQYLRITGGDMFGDVTWHEEDNSDYSVTLNSNGVNIKDNSTTYYSKLLATGLEIGDQDVSTTYTDSSLKFNGIGRDEARYGRSGIDIVDESGDNKEIHISASNIRFVDDIDPIDENARVTELKYSGLNTELVDTNKLVANEISSPALDVKVDKVEGKDLSSNDFSDSYKEKLDGIISITESEINTLFD